MNNTEEFAAILLAIIQRGLFNDRRFKRTIGTLVRDSTESTHPHCTTDYRSVMAREAITALAPLSPEHYHRLCTPMINGLRHEHMVPTSQRIRILSQMENPTVESIAQSLERFGMRATIHYEEDAQLSQAGFKSRMPASFWDKTSTLYMNPLARYIEAELLPDLRPRQGNCWFADEQLLD